MVRLYSMKVRNWLMYAANLLLPLGAAFFSGWDGKVTAASIVSAILWAIAHNMSPPKSPTPPINVAGLLVLSAVAGTSCLKAVPVIGPTVSCVSTIVADALKGMTLDQILNDAGPQCVQSIDQVIAILVGEAARNPMVRETLAYRDQRTVAALKAAQP